MLHLADPTSIQLNLNSIVVGAVSISIAVNAYFLKRVMDKVDHAIDKLERVTSKVKIIEFRQDRHDEEYRGIRRRFDDFDKEEDHDG